MTTLILILASALLIACPIIMFRLSGEVSLALIVPVAFAFYLPARGLLMHQGLLTVSTGENLRALLAERSQPKVVAEAALVMSLGFAIGAVLVVASCMRPHLRTETKVFALGQYQTGLLLYLVGSIGLVVQMRQSYAIVGSGSGAVGGPLEQLALLLFLGFCLGVFLLLVGRPVLTRGTAVMVAVPYPLCLVSGSKDTFLILAMATLGALLFRRRIEKNASLTKRVVVWLSLAAAVIVFAVFPSIQAYRIGVEQRGLPTQQALAGIPDTLRQYDVATGTNTLPGERASFWLQSLTYLSNRFHGYDSLAIIAAAPRRPSILTPAALADISVGSVYPADFSHQAANPVGRIFATEYWSPGTTSDSYIAMGAPTQGLLAGGLALAFLVAACLGLATGLAHVLLAGKLISSQLYGIVFLLAATAFERDVVLIFTTMVRRLIFVWLLLQVCTHRARPEARQLGLTGRIGPQTGLREV